MLQRIVQSVRIRIGTQLPPEVMKELTDAQGTGFRREQYFDELNAMFPKYREVTYARTQDGFEVREEVRKRGQFEKPVHQTVQTYDAAGRRIQRQVTRFNYD